MGARAVASILRADPAQCRTPRCTCCALGACLSTTGGRKHKVAFSQGFRQTCGGLGAWLCLRAGSRRDAVQVAVQQQPVARLQQQRPRVMDAALADLQTWRQLSQHGTHVSSPSMQMLHIWLLFVMPAATAVPHSGWHCTRPTR